jgi:hypothetical protein
MNRIILLYALLGARFHYILGQEPQLIASAPYRMILRPTSQGLNYASLQALEEAASSTILLGQDGTFLDIEVAVQQVDYIPPGNDTSSDDPSTRIRFFVLGSTRIFNNTDETTLRDQLNELVEVSFEDFDTMFLQLLSSDPILGEALSVTVTPILALPGPGIKSEEDKRQTLSLLDIVLVIISGLILLGIVYMVVQHHKDRGFIENERQRVLNQRIYNNGDILVAAEQGATSPIASGQDDGDDETPSTPSTTYSVVKVNVKPASPDRSVHITTTTISAMDPDVLLKQESSGPIFLSENLEKFEKSKWFHPAHTKPRVLRKFVRQPVSVIAEGDEGDDGDESSDGVYEDDSSESSEDVFHLECSATSSSADDTTKSVASAASAVTEWMQTIRVISTKIDSQISEDTIRVISTNIDNQISEDTIRVISSNIDNQISDTIRIISTNIDNQISEDLTLSMPSQDEEKDEHLSSAAASSSMSSSSSSSSGATSLAEKASALDGSSMEQTSLERSMASSRVDRRPAEKVEV